MHKRAFLGALGILMLALSGRADVFPFLSASLTLELPAPYGKSIFTMSCSNTRPDASRQITSMKIQTEAGTFEIPKTQYWDLGNPSEPRFMTLDGTKTIFIQIRALSQKDGREIPATIVTTDFKTFHREEPVRIPEEPQQTPSREAYQRALTDYFSGRYEVALHEARRAVDLDYNNLEARRLIDKISDDLRRFNKDMRR